MRLLRTISDTARTTNYNPVLQPVYQQVYIDSDEYYRVDFRDWSVSATIHNIFSYSQLRSQILEKFKQKVLRI